MTTTGQLETVHVALSWGISRGRDTYGYNIRRLVDTSTGARFRCMGGGYDMTGTVLADWFTSTRPDLALTLAPRAGWTYDYTAPGTADDANRRTRNDGPDALYGVGAVVKRFGNTRTVRVEMDGACGISTVQRAMEAAGVRFVTRLYAPRSGETTGYVLELPAPGRLEGVCRKCGETFIPDGPTDLEHLETLTGAPCGGAGVIVGPVPVVTLTRVTRDAARVHFHGGGRVAILDKRDGWGETLEVRDRGQFHSLESTTWDALETLNTADPGPARTAYYTVGGAR